MYTIYKKLLVEPTTGLEFHENLRHQNKVYINMENIFAE